MKHTLLIFIFVFQSLYTFSQQNEAAPDKHEVYKKMLERQPYHKLLTGSPEEQPKLDDWQKRVEFERLKTLDPATGEIPVGAMDKAREFVEKSLQKAKAERKAAGIPNIKWKEVGPTNVGGRTRGIMYDPNDATRSKVWSGGVSGGLWYNNNIRDVNSGWNKVDDFWENLSISCLAFDPTNPKIFYVGTGEISGSVVQEVGFMWKSEDAGKTWKKLPNKPLGAFYMYRIVVNKKGEIFVATGTGIQKSMDGGITWQTVLNDTNGGATDIEMASDEIMYISNYRGKIYRSNDSSGNQWTEITPPANTNPYGNRTELGLALSTQGDKQIIYAMNPFNWFQKSMDAGKTWQEVNIPTLPDGSRPVWNQAGYNAVITVHPTNPNLFYANGTQLNRTLDGGKTWDIYEYRFIHPDQHGVVFNDKNPNETLFSNDGGVYYSADAGKSMIAPPKIEERNKNYSTTQFYSLAIRGIQNDETIIGGSQDNGSWKIGNTTADIAKALGYGGDGGYCFIDEDNPDIMIGSTQNGAFYSIDRNNLKYSSFTTTGEGSFINPADYNSKTNILFANAGNNSRIRRYNLNKSPNKADYLGLNKDIGSFPSALKTTSNDVLFLGTYTGEVFKLTGLDNSTANVKKISSDQMPFGNINCIEVGVDENELLTVYSNYNVSSVWYTNDGGQNWINKDYDGFGLPNIPVKWAVFNPNNRKQVLLATDLGIWSTNDITANNPNWELSSVGLGLARCDMIKCRASDGFVAVATHGRGFFSSYAFAPESNSPSKKIITTIPTEQKKLCAGNKLNVSFITEGSFVANEEYKIFLSDETGNFLNERLIGQGTQSPIICTLPLPTQTGNPPEIPDLISGTNYKYRIEAPKSLFSVVSNEPISIYTPPSKILGTVTSICQGSSTTLQSSSVKNTYIYQWSRNRSKIANSNNENLVVKESGVYSLEINEGGCSAIANSYSVNVGAFLDGPSIFTPQNSTCEGYKIKAYTIDKPDYITQWQKDGVDIPQATTKDFVIEKSGLYTVTYLQGSCKAVSESVNINIGKNITTTIESSFGPNQALCRGVQQIFYMNNSTLEGMKFQWQLNGKDIPNATKSNISTYNEGEYALRLSLGKCAVTSNIIKFAYQNELKTDITSDYNITKMCKGGTVTLAATYLPNYNSSNVFIWKRNGIEIGTSNYGKFQVSESGDYTVRVQQGNCAANSSSSIKITVDTTSTLPLKLIANTGLEICEGSSGYLYLPNREIYPSDMQFSWQKDGKTIIENANTYSFFLESGSYTLTAQKNGCKGVSNPYIFKVGKTQTSPTITQYINGVPRIIDKEINNCDGQLSILTPVFIFDNNLGYKIRGTFQWQKDGKNIPNATTELYGVKESGTYTVLYQERTCVSTSKPIVVNYTSVPKDITPNTFQSVCDKSLTPITFKTISTESDLVYQWKANGTNLAGETRNSFTAANEGDYQLIVNRGLCSSASEVVSIKKSSTPKTTISTNATNPVLCFGDIVSLKADKQDGINYRWYVNSSAILAPSNKSLVVNESGKYTLLVDDGNCIYRSDTLELNFLKVPNKFSTTDSEPFFCENSSTILSSIANADTTIKYQWKLNNVNIPNATKSSLNISKEGNYQFSTSIGNCSSTSEEVKVKMISLPKAIITSDLGLNVCAGQSVKLSANKETGLTYQWLKDAQKISQSLSDTLRVSENGNYAVITDNGKCKNTSGALKLNFIKVPNQITPSATEQTLCENSFFTLSAVAINDTSIKYQWKRNNENISLATANSLKISQEGSYQFVALKSNCAINSPLINVKMAPFPKSEITTTNDLGTICIGETVVLNGNKEDGITYQWKKDSVNIEKASTQTLQANQSGKYSLITSRNNCSTVSNAVNLYFNEKPTASISGGATLYLTESSPLKIDLTSLSPWTIKISDGKEYTTNSTPYTINVTPLDSNAYTITSVVNRCGLGSSKGAVMFKVLNPLASEPVLFNDPILLASSPNPFNQSCIIKYGLPKPTNVKLVLYDNQGIEKVILVDEKRASGWHTQTLTSKSLTIGSYILRLEVNGQILSQKIMLVAE
jgi:trimeric autotransporter adhesin